MSGNPDPTAERFSDPVISIPDHERIRLISRGSYGEVWLAKAPVPRAAPFSPHFFARNRLAGER